MEVLVTGGTGVLGSAVVAELVSRVHAVRVLTRHPAVVPDTARFIEGSLAWASEVADAVDGVRAIIHCATDPRNHRTVDAVGTATLVEVADRSGAPHIVFPGIVGSDVIPLGYYKSKIVAEASVQAARGGYSIIRATQFHTLIWSALTAMSRLPLLIAPRDTRFQPIDHRSVAHHLVDAMEAGPSGRLDDVGGPNAYDATDLATSHGVATGTRKKVLTINIPGVTGAAFRAGGNLTSNRDDSGASWNDFVADRIASQSV